MWSQGDEHDQLQLALLRFTDPKTKGKYQSRPHIVKEPQVKMVSFFLVEFLTLCIRET